MADEFDGQNHYEVLGLERRASAAEVKAAYRLRSHMFHPDKYETYPEPLRGQLKAEAAKEFKKLTAAYDVLRDPAKRAAHDRQLDAGWTGWTGRAVRGGRVRTAGSAAGRAERPERPERAGPTSPPRRPATHARAAGATPTA